MTEQPIKRGRGRPRKRPPKPPPMTFDDLGTVADLQSPERALAMPGNIDLDQEVDRVLFWQGRYTRIPTVGEPHQWFRSTGPGNVAPIPHYSTEFDSAVEVVDRLQVARFELALFSIENGGGWRCRLARDAAELVNVVAETAPLAICRAALAAVGAADPDAALVQSEGQAITTDQPANRGPGRPRGRKPKPRPQTIDESFTAN